MAAISSVAQPTIAPTENSSATLSSTSGACSASVPSTVGVTFRRVLRSELLKFTSLRSTVVLLLCTVAVMVGFAALAAWGIGTMLEATGGDPTAMGGPSGTGDMVHTLSGTGISFAQLIAGSLGVSRLRIALRHVLPNAMAPVLVQTFALGAQFLIVQAALGFLGLGAPPPAPSWGQDMADAYLNFTSDPFATIVPGVAITLGAWSISSIGDGLRDLLVRN